MNKRMLALAITALATTAWAQVPPTATPPVARAPVAVPQALPPLPTGANPFTGVTKAQSEIDRSDEELRRLRGLSTQKLALQRDELEALRIELDKKKLMDALNPPKPVEIKVISAPAVVTAPGAIRTPIATKKPAVVVEKPAPTPPQIIAPSATKYEAPQVLGVIDIGGQKVAMMRFDGQTFRAASGSTVGGKPIASIEPNGVQWGTSFLTVASTSSAPPSILITDDRTDPKNRSISAQPTTLQPAQMSQVQAPPTIQPYSGPSSPLTLSPQGATRSTNGASGPTGVLQLPPPPPTLAR